MLPWCLPTPEASARERVARYATIAFTLLAFVVTGSRASFVLLLVWIVWALVRRVHAPATYKLAAVGGLLLITLASVLATGGRFFEDYGTAFFGGRFALWFQDGVRAVVDRAPAGRVGCRRLRRGQGRHVHA